MRFLSAALIPLALLVPSFAEAQQKRADAPSPGPVGKAVAPCGARILPLVEGNRWTYGFVAAPIAPRPEMMKLSPSQPKEVAITVKSIEVKGTETVITLEEKSVTDLSKDPKKQILDERLVTTTITCSPTKFEIAPESFFFAGEPGGQYGIVFDKVERPKDTTWKLVAGTIGDREWREDLITHFTRTPFEGSSASLDSGKLELERKFTPAEPERVNTKVGWYTAERLAVTTTGRVTLDHPQPDVLPMELPAAWLSQLWLVPNVGLIQVLNSYAHMYSLIDVQLK